MTTINNPTFPTAATIRLAAGVVRALAYRCLAGGTNIADPEKFAYSARDLDEIAEELESEQQARDAAIDGLARDLFDVQLPDSTAIWPQSLYADQIRSTAAALFDIGWRKGEASAS